MIMLISKVHPSVHILILYFAKWTLIKKFTLGNSLAAQWLGLGTFTAKGLVQFLVEELKSCKLHHKKINKIYKYCITNTW